MKAITVIFTDKLSEVKAFYLQYFPGASYTDEGQNFFVNWGNDGAIHYADTAIAAEAPTKTTLRLLLPHAELEQERLASLGAPCSDIKSESNWGAWYAPAVKYFTLQDPSGSQLAFYTPDYGGKRQLMTTGDGTETRKVHPHE